MALNAPSTAASSMFGMRRPGSGSSVQFHSFSNIGARHRIRDVAIARQLVGNEAMSQEPCTLFWPRSGFTPTPGRLDVAGRHGEVRNGHDSRRALAVLCDAEAVVDGCVAARRIETRRAADGSALTPVYFSIASGELRSSETNAFHSLKSSSSQRSRTNCSLMSPSVAMT